MTRYRERMIRFTSDVLRGNMRSTNEPPPGDLNDILHTEDDWSLVSTKIHTIVGHQGWRCIIKHDCELVGSPYWMLIESHKSPTLCVYCKMDMPDSIVALFKFLNDEVIR